MKMILIIRKLLKSNTSQTLQLIRYLYCQKGSFYFISNDFSFTRLIFFIFTLTQVSRLLGTFSQHWYVAYSSPHLQQHLHVAHHPVHVTYNTSIKMCMWLCVRVGFCQVLPVIHPPHRHDWEIWNDTRNYSVFPLTELQCDLLPFPFTHTRISDESGDQYIYDCSV